MKKFFHIIPRYIKYQKRKTILTIIGIMLSVALISSIGILSESIKHGTIQQAIELYGAHHGSFKNLNSQQISILKNHMDIQKCGSSNYVGSFEIPKGDITLALSEMDRSCIDILNFSLVKGNFPEKSGEIAIEEWMLPLLKLKGDLGEKFSLEFKQGIMKDDGNYLEHKYTAEFTLVGILKDVPASKIVKRSFGIISIGTAKSLIPNDMVINQTLYQVKKGLPIRETTKKVAASIGLKEDEIWYNDGLLYALGETEKPNYVYIFLGLVIIAATVAAIYNIFHISVMERIQQFGMLRSIGATPHQIKTIIFGEASIYSIIAIPLGILIGIIADKLIVSRLSIIGNVTNEIVVPLYVILLSAGIGIVTVFLSTINPARLASKISPIDAIKSNSNIIKDSRVKERKITKLIGRFFGISGKLAYQNLWRNKKRTIITIFSMSLGCILFIIFSYFTSAANIDNILSKRINGDYSIIGGTQSYENGYTDKDVSFIKKIDGVEDVKKVQFEHFISTHIYEKNITEETKEFISKYNQDFKLDSSGRYKFNSTIFGLEDDRLKSNIRYSLGGKIDIEKLKNGPYVLIYQGGDFNYKVGDEIICAYGEDNKELKFIVAGILSDVSVYMGFKGVGPEIVMHQDMFKKYIGSMVYKKLDIKVDKNANQANIENALKKIAEKIEDGTVISMENEKKLFQGQMNQIKTLFLSLIAIIAIIGMFNIVNTITTNLITRTKEFGMLRAIGMSSDELKHMIRLEGAMYGVISGILGTIIGSILSYVLYIIMKKEATYMEWQVPWLPLIEIFAGTIILGVISIIAPLRRIGSMNIVDATRNME